MSVTALFVFAAAVLFLSSKYSGTIHGSGTESAGDHKEVASESERAQKYSKFSHNIPQHKKECSECHKFPSSNWNKVRSEADAFPDITDYPKHQSCLNCHRKQFFSGRKPVICSICHTNPSPRDSSRHSFPNPREVFDESKKGKGSYTAFAVYFQHEFHIAMMGGTPGDTANKNGGFVKASFRKMPQSDSCVMCHQVYMPQGDGDEEYATKPPEKLGDEFWLKKGTFMSAPIGHTQCFTCHSEDSGLNPSPKDCGTCHLLKPKDPPSDFDPSALKRMEITDKLTVTSWRKRNSAATFRHEWFSHAEMDCTFCHNVSEIDTVDLTVKRVAVTSCSGCHITATSDDGGILNYEIDSRNSDPKFQCAKCHLSYGRGQIPESHLKAIADLAN